jgi:hypothetical protein
MNHKSILILLSTFCFLLIAAPVFAQTPFVTCDPALKLGETRAGDKEKGEPKTVRSCDLCELLHSAQIIIRWFWQISIPIGIGFIVYGAIIIMIAGGSTERVQKGRQVITSAVWGVIIALAAWILINTLISALVSKEFKLKDRKFIENWYEIKC